MPNITKSRLPNVSDAQPLSHFGLVGLGAAASFTRLAFIAPFRCCLITAAFVDDTLFAADATDYWSFDLADSDGNPLYTAVRSTTVEGGALVANQTEPLAVVAAVAQIAAGTKVYFRGTRVESAATLAAHNFRVALTYQPA